MAAVAQAPGQHDVHPLLRHPRPITGDSARAQRMLGLIADSEEKLSGLHREKSKTTRWLERPLHTQRDVSELESEKEFEYLHTNISNKVDAHVDEQPLVVSKPWTTPYRPTLLDSENAVQNCAESKLDTTLTRRRPKPLQALRPISYNSQHLLSPEWTASPATMSPQTQRQRPISLQPNSRHTARGSFSSIDSSASAPRFAHPQTWPAPPTQCRPQGRTERPLSYQAPSSTSEEGYFSYGSPKSSEQRPRPTSFATYQHRDRRNSKIASSRGLRNNSHPNFSRPSTAGAPKAVPGESIESDILYNQFADNEVGPPSPSSPIRTALEGFEIEDHKAKDDKRHKNRWSHTFKKLRKRRVSSATYDQKPAMNFDINDLRQMNLTEQNLHWYEKEVSQSPMMSHTSSPATRPLPTPSYSPLEVKHPDQEAPLPKPFAPWAEAPPSPAMSYDRPRGSDISMSPTRRRRASSRLSIENVISSRPESMHSRNSSFVMPSPVRHLPPPPVQPMFEPTASPRLGSRRGTPALERTCIICKTSQEPSEFVSHRISGNCWHEPATCMRCLRAHIEKCVEARGWDHCTCPECGEVMTYEDMSTFADEDSFIKWED